MMLSRSRAFQVQCIELQRLGGWWRPDGLDSFIVKSPLYNVSSLRARILFTAIFSVP